MEQPESILRMVSGGVCMADEVERVMPVFHLISNRQGLRSLGAQFGLEANRVSPAVHSDDTLLRLPESTLSAPLTLRCRLLTSASVGAVLTRYRIGSKNSQFDDLRNWLPALLHRGRELMESPQVSLSRYYGERDTDEPEDSFETVDPDSLFVSGELDLIRRRVSSDEPYLIVRMHIRAQEDCRPRPGEFETPSDGDSQLLTNLSLQFLGNRSGLRYLSSIFLERAEAYYRLTDDPGDDPDDHFHHPFYLADAYDKTLSVLGEFRMGALSDDNRAAVIEKYGMAEPTEGPCATRWLCGFLDQFSACKIDA